MEGFWHVWSHDESALQFGHLRLDLKTGETPVQAILLVTYRDRVDRSKPLRRPVEGMWHWQPPSEADLRLSAEPACRSAPAGLSQRIG